jgi:hypothetical protein
MEAHKYNNMSLVTALGYEYKNSEKARASNIRKNKAPLPMEKIGPLVDWIMSERHSTPKKKNHYKAEILKGKLPTDLIASIPTHYKSEAYNEQLLVEAKHNAIIQSEDLSKYIEACEYNQERAKKFKTKIDQLNGMGDTHEPTEVEILEEATKHQKIVSILYDRLGDLALVYSLIELKIFYSQTAGLSFDDNFNPDKIAQECIEGFIDAPLSLKDISRFDKSHFSECELNAVYKKQLLAREDDSITISDHKISGPDNLNSEVDDFIDTVQISTLDFTTRPFKQWSNQETQAAIRLGFTLHRYNIAKPTFKTDEPADYMLTELSRCLTHAEPDYSINTIDEVYGHYAEINNKTKNGLDKQESAFLLNVYDFLKGKTRSNSKLKAIMLASLTPNNDIEPSEGLNNHTPEQQYIIDFFPFKLSEHELRALTLPSGQWEQHKPALHSLTVKIDEQLTRNGIDSYYQDLHAEIFTEKQIAKGRINQHLPILDLGIRPSSISLLSYIEELWDKELVNMPDIISALGKGAED